MITDETLAKAKQGDETALNRLLDMHKDLAFTVALKYASDRDDAADIVQEAFIQVFLHIAGFKSEAKFSTWLFRIVYHEALRHRRMKKQYAELDEAAHIADVEEAVEPLKLAETKLAMGRLTEMEYTMVNLFYLGGQGIKEIELITQQSKANIKIILHRARKKLSAYLIKTT